MGAKFILSHIRLVWYSVLRNMCEQCCLTRIIQHIFSIKDVSGVMVGLLAYKIKHVKPLIWSLFLLFSHSTICSILSWPNLCKVSLLQDLCSSSSLCGYSFLIGRYGFIVANQQIHCGHWGELQSPFNAVIFNPNLYAYKWDFLKKT